MTTAENVMTATTAIAAAGNSGRKVTLMGLRCELMLRLGLVDEDAEAEGDV